MTLKIQPAPPEEQAFAAQVNKVLHGSGAAVHPYLLVDTETGRVQEYRLTCQCGSKRHTISADGPFHYDPAEDVIKRVREWMAAAGAGERWTTDLERADGATPQEQAY